MRQIAVLVLLVSTGWAEQNTDIQTLDNAGLLQHAAVTVAYLHDSMLDPASFVLDSVLITKPDKKGKISICYAFRSHNKMGGYSEGRAVEWGVDHNKLSVFSVDNGAGKYPGYDVGWMAPCKDKSIDREITASVSGIAPNLYKKTL